METNQTHQSSPRGNGKSFFQDTQKLTFSLGLVSGLAIMAITGFLIVSVRISGDSSGTTAFKKNSNTNTTAANSNTNSAGTTQPDAVTIAKAIGLDEQKFTSCLNSGKYKDRVNKDLSEGSAAGVDGTPTTFVNGTPVSGAQPYSVLKAAIDAAMSGTKGTANVPAVSKDDHVIGGGKPTVYLIEYSDFQCPYCHSYAPTLEQALTEYGSKIALVYRHFPLTSIHPLAEPLAEGSECAVELGGKDKFWTFHDYNFQV